MIERASRVCRQRRLWQCLRRGGGGWSGWLTRGVVQNRRHGERRWGFYNGNHNSGGSGGGIFIECAKFRGAAYASLTARGTRGYSNANSNDGGGFGGRIAVWSGKAYHDGIPAHRLIVSETPPAGFAGAIDVAGGGSSYNNDGEPGTVVFVEVLPPFGTMLLLR